MLDLSTKLPRPKDTAEEIVRYSLKRCTITGPCDHTQSISKQIVGGLTKYIKQATPCYVKNVSDAKMFNRLSYQKQLIVPAAKQTEVNNHITVSVHPSVHTHLVTISIGRIVTFYQCISLHVVIRQLFQGGWAEQLLCLLHIQCKFDATVCQLWALLTATLLWLGFCVTRMH